MSVSVKCVVGGCNATFASQGGLARHVPTHFSSQNSSKLSSQTKVKEESPSKAGINKRRKLKHKRRRTLRMCQCNFNPCLILGSNLPLSNSILFLPTSTTSRLFWCSDHGCNPPSRHLPQSSHSYWEPRQRPQCCVSQYGGYQHLIMLLY